MITAVIASVPLLAAIPGAAQVLPSVARPLAIDIRSEPITAFDVRDPSRRQFGLLEFRGGLVLRPMAALGAYPPFASQPMARTSSH
ncbi:MAG TPA: hypothetical protein VN975_01900 [Xanthobacteraceae bacterium]|nr:hypothetical protein [Xanthobacteraceae bacterium]